MGSIKKAISEAVGKSDEAQVKERLNLLLALATSKLKEYKHEVNKGFVDPAVVEKMQIPGIRAIKFIEQYHVASSSKFNEQVQDHLKRATNAFFNLGSGKNKESIKNGLIAIMNAGMASFIGSTSAGQKEKKFYIVIPENNAFVRVDIFLWKYKTVDKSLSSNTDTAVAYLLCKSVVDHKKLKLDELIYLVTDTLAKRQSVPQEIEVKEFTRADESEALTNKLINGDIGYPPNTIILKDGITRSEDMEKSFNIVKGSFSDFYPTKDSKDKPSMILEYKAGNPLLKSNNNFDANKHFNVNDWREWDGYPSVEAPNLADVDDYITELTKLWRKIRKELKDMQDDD